MTDKEMIDVIQENAESLRKEVSSRIESDLKFGQMLVAGVAAIAVRVFRLGAQGAQMHRSAARCG